MKKNYILLALMAVVSLLSACQKEEKEEVRPTAGVWVEQLHPDGAERVLTFMDGTDAVDYSVTYFSPDISNEKMSAPFSIDKKSDELRISFSGVENRMGISEIVIKPKENRKVWYGTMNYSVPGKKTDTLYFSYAGLTYSGVLSEEAASIELPSDKDMGPMSCVSELPKLEWVNPRSSDYYPVSNDDKESILAYIGKQIAAAAGKQLGKELLSVIWNELFPSTDPIAEDIKSIMQDILVIQKQLEIIQKQLEEIKMELIRQNMSARNSTYIALSSSVSEIMLKIEGAIKGNPGNAEAASAAIQELILEWGKETVNGNPIYLAVQNYVGVSTASESPYAVLYDDYARETFAWECDGYEWREMLRTTDEALISATSALTVMYYTARNQAQPTVITEETLKMEIDKQVKLLQTMESEYTRYPVEHHPDQMICQISGLHRVFDKKVEWRDLGHPDWYPSTLEIWLSAEWLVFGTGQFKESEGISTCKQRFMTEDEYDKLVKYYSNKKEISLLSLFKEMGFDVMTDDLDSSIACMLFPGFARDLPAGGMGFERRAIQVYGLVTNKERTKVDDRSVGIVSVDQVPIGDPEPQQFYEWRFGGYIKYNNYTWFNLQVLKR